MHVVHLLLEVFHVLILLFQLFLQATNLARFASVVEGSRAASVGLGVTLETLVLFLQTENVKDHGVGAVQDEREEEGEATEVHVALRVEFAGLDFHALGSPEDSGAVNEISLLSRAKSQGRLENLPAFSLALTSRGKLELNTVNTIHAVDEENENEDEGNLHAILNFGDEGVLRDEGE